MTGGLDRLGGESAMFQTILVADRSAAAGAVHPTDAMTLYGRRAALEPAPFRGRRASPS